MLVPLRRQPTARGTRDECRPREVEEQVGDWRSDDPSTQIGRGSRVGVDDLTVRIDDQDGMLQGLEDTGGGCGLKLAALREVLVNQGATPKVLRLLAKGNLQKQD